MLHSWPKFADPDAAKMPTPAYGQTYLCIAIDLATASALATEDSKGLGARADSGLDHHRSMDAALLEHELASEARAFD
jgi:hypothetical protein